MSEAVLCPVCKLQPFERDAVGISDGASFELTHEFPAGSYTVCINCSSALKAEVHNVLRLVTDEEFIDLEPKARRTIKDMQVVVSQYRKTQEALKAGKPKPEMTPEVASAYQHLHDSLGRIAAIFGSAGAMAEALEGMTEAALYSAIKSATDMKDRPAYRRVLIAVLEAELLARGKHDMAPAAPATGA